MNGHVVGAVLSAATFAVVCTTILSGAQQDSRLRQGPDLLLLQGPGSDIRATVRALVAAERRPQGQSGVVVEDVVRDGPAAAAGLRAGDIVTEFDSVAIVDPKQFERIVRDTAPGRRVRMVFWRDGNRREASLTPVPGTAR